MLIWVQSPIKSQCRKRFLSFRQSNIQYFVHKQMILGKRSGLHLKSSMFRMRLVYIENLSHDDHCPLDECEGVVVHDVQVYVHQDLQDHSLSTLYSQQLHALLLKLSNQSHIVLSLLLILGVQLCFNVLSFPFFLLNKQIILHANIIWASGINHTQFGKSFIIP